MFAAVEVELPPDHVYVVPPVAERDTVVQAVVEPVIPAVGMALTVIPPDTLLVTGVHGEAPLTMQ